MNLEDRYPERKDFIKRAKDAGYADHEIEKYIVSSIPDEMTLGKALGKKYSGGALNVIGQIVSTPTHLITAALPGEGGYLERFARGIDPSEYLPEETPGIGKIAVDIVADPLNLLIGAGVITKLAKVGKISKAAKTAARVGSTPIEEITKSALSTLKNTDDAIEFVAKRSEKEISDAISGLERLFNAEKEVSKRVEIAQQIDILKQAAGKTPAPDWVTKAVKGKKAPMTDIERLGRGWMRKDEFYESILKQDPDLVKAARGEGMSNEAMTNFIKKGYDDETVKLMDDKLNLGGALIGRKKALDIAEMVEKSPVKEILEGGLKKPVGEYAGRQAMAGRTLQAVKSDKELMIAAYKNRLAQLKKADPENYKNMLKAMEVELGEVVGKGELNPGFIKKFIEWSVMIKLTGLSTHLKNTIGNTLMLTLRIPEKMAAGTIDSFIYGAKRLVGKEAKRAVYAKEVFPEFVGMVQGTKQAFRDFWKMLVSPTKYLEEVTKAGEAMVKHGGVIEGKLGQIIRAPARLLGATDVLFKSLNKNMELFSQAARIAYQEGLKGEKFAKRFVDIIADPSKEKSLLEIMRKSARERVFQEELGKFASTVNQMRTKMPWTRLIVPFWNTPMNLLKQGFQRTPLSIILPSTQRHLMLKFIPKDRIGMELAGRMVSGSIIGSVLTYAAFEGRVSSGGPKSQSKRSLMRMSGWQPYSIKVGDTWVSYRGFEPISTWLRNAGDIAEGSIKEEGYVDFAGKFALSYIKQFAENPFFLGLHDFFQGVDNPETSAPRFMASLAVGSTVPVLLQQWLTRVYDPTVRKPLTKRGVGKFWDETKSRLPLGASKTVTPMRNIFGEPIVRQAPISQAFGFTMSFRNDSKLGQELSRLSQLDEKSLSIGKPSRNIMGYDLTEEEYDRYIYLTGTLFKETLEKFINSPAYDKIPDDLKIKAIRSIKTKINNAIRHREFDKYYRR